jgi:hypothetical protein
VSRMATLAEARVLLMVCCRAGPDGFCHFGKSVATDYDSHGFAMVGMSLNTVRGRCCFAMLIFLTIQSRAARWK